MIQVDRAAEKAETRGHKSATKRRNLRNLSLKLIRATKLKPQIGGGNHIDIMNVSHKGVSYRYRVLEFVIAADEVEAMVEVEDVLGVPRVQVQLTYNPGR